VVDTLMIARRKFPGAPASLDALCKRYAIDNAHREKHGALLDAELLAQVYIELIGGRQAGLELAPAMAAETGVSTPGAPARRGARQARLYSPSAEELAAHEAFVAGLKDPLWRK
jgi:DNA polymerase-3 subunit epsilon